MTRLLILAVAIGLLLPDFASFLRPLLYPSLFAIMVFTLIQIDLLKLSHALGRDTLKVAFISAIQMLLVPVAIGLVFRVVAPAPVFALPVILVTAAGSMFGTPAIAVLLGFTGRFTLLGVLVSTALLPLSLPLVWMVYTGDMLQMELSTYGFRLFLYIVLPALIAWVYRLASRSGIRLPGEDSMKLGAVIGLAIFAIAIMDGVTERLFKEPELVFGLIVLAFVLHFGLFSLTRIFSRSLDPAISVEASLLSAFRNIGLIIAISGPYLPSDFFLFAGVWQIPMYLSPWLFQRFLRFPKQHV
ncbi:MAG: hypothetical protein ACR2QW_07255 [bacterium]